MQTLSQTQFDSLPDRPADGTFLQSGATGLIWRVVKGVATFVPSWAPYGGPKPTIVVDQAALDNAGTGGVWNLLTSGKPAPRMTGPTTLGTRPRQDPRSPGSAATPSSAVGHLRRPVPQGPVGRQLRLLDPARVLAGHDGDQHAAGSARRLRLLRLGPGPQPGRPALRLVRPAVPGPGPGRQAAQRLLGLEAQERHRRFYSGSALSTTSKGATLVRTGAKVKRVGLVATTCRTCGKVAVLVDGKRIGTGEPELGPSRHRRQVFMLPAVKRGPATITLRVLTSGLTVQVDGLVLSRT